MAKNNNTEKTQQAVPAGYVPALKKVYKEEIVPKLMKEFSYSTVMQVPRLVKITINQGVGDATGDKKLVDIALQELTAITGQKAVATASRKDISNFKLRKGMPIGAKVTLRALPRCTSSLRDLSVYLSLVSGISTEFLRNLTEEETILSESRSRLFSQRSTSTRLQRFSEWRSLS